MPHGTHETEIKLRVPDVKTARQLLRAAGFRVAKRRIFESNVIFDLPGLTLRKRGGLLRIREAGGAKLTYKGPPEVSKHKSREELELDLGDAATMRSILERLGYHEVFRYEKFRTEYKHPVTEPRPQGSGGTSGVATLDETPIGTYLELEGAPSWIDRTARRLGFSESEYITASYGSLFLQWRSEVNEKSRDMVFRK